MVEEDKGIVDLVREAQKQAGNEGEAPYAEVPAPRVPPTPATPEMGQVHEIDEQLAFLLENIRSEQIWVPVKLPSRGHPYGGELEEVKIRAFTFEDERALKHIGESSTPEEAVKSLLQSCIQGVNINALTIADKNYLLYKIREISYGSKYVLEGKCSSCSTSNMLNLELSSLTVNYMDNYDEDMTLVLPDSQKKARIRMPMVSDEPYIDSIDKVMNNISRFVVEIEGITDDKVLYAFLRKTTLKDVVTLRNKIFDIECGFEKDIVFSCIKCNTQNKSLLALNDNFFTVS